MAGKFRRKEDILLGGIKELMGMADIHKYLQQRRAKYDADWKAYHERNRQRRQKIKQFLKLVLHWMKHPEQHVTPWDRF